MRFFQQVLFFTDDAIRFALCVSHSAPSRTSEKLSSASSTVSDFWPEISPSYLSPNVFYTLLSCSRDVHTCSSGYFCSCCVRLVTLTTFVLSRSRTATVGFAASTTTSCSTFSSLSVFVSNQPYPHPSPIKLSVYLNVSEGLLHPISVFQARCGRRSFASSCWRFHSRWWTTRHTHYKSDISMLWSKLFVNSFYKFTLPSNTAVVVCSQVDESFIRSKIDAFQSRVEVLCLVSRFVASLSTKASREFEISLWWLNYIFWSVLVGLKKILETLWRACFIWSVLRAIWLLLLFHHRRVCLQDEPTRCSRCVKSGNCASMFSSTLSLVRSIPSSSYKCLVRYAPIIITSLATTASCWRHC